MSEKPEALRLADAMWAGRLDYGIAGEIAAELRRLHAENERLRRVVLCLVEACTDEDVRCMDNLLALARAALQREDV